MKASVGCTPDNAALKLRDILLHRRHILPGNGAIARRSGNGALASHTLTLRGLGKISPIGTHGHSALSLKPGKAMSDIGGVANLPLLTIIDDVHASVHLLPHYVGDGTLYAGVEGGWDRGSSRRPGLPRWRTGPGDAAGSPCGW